MALIDDDRYTGDEPECPMCGEDVDIIKLDVAIFRCGVCHEIYYGVDSDDDGDGDSGGMAIVSGIDLVDQLAAHRERMGANKAEETEDGLERTTERVAPTLGQVVREVDGLIDIGTFQTEHLITDTGNYGDSDCSSDGDNRSGNR